MPVGQNQTVHFGPFELDVQCGELRKSGIRLKLQGQPIQVLEILLQKPGQLVTREEIRQRLWTSDTFVDFDHSLNTAVKKLRQTLGDEADTPRYIETLPKRGYRFIGEVEREESKEETREAAVAVLPIGPLEPRPSNRMRRWRRLVVGSVLGLLVIASGVLLYSVLKPMPQPRIVGSHHSDENRNAKRMGREADCGSWVHLFPGRSARDSRGPRFRLAYRCGCPLRVEKCRQHPLPRATLRTPRGTGLSCWICRTIK